MKKSNRLVMFLFALLALALLATPAAAEQYFSWKIGASLMEVSNIEGVGLYEFDTVNKSSTEDDSFVFSVAYGYNQKPVRLEVELSLRNDFDYSADPIFTSNPAAGSISSNINSHTLFVNMYVDLLPNMNVVPYLGGGVGLSRNIWEWETSGWWDDRESSTEFAWNAGGGVAIKMGSRLMFDVSYRYINFGGVEISNQLKIEDITTNEIQLGLRLNF